MANSARFLWVTLQVNNLCNQICDADIRESLATIPRGLPETYQQILSRLGTEITAPTVRKIFRWVAVVKRPMHLEELREAIAVHPGDKFLQRDRLVNQMERLVSWCGDLVTVDEDDHLVQFAHHSIKEYLISTNYDSVSDFHFDLDAADHAAGIACIAYLNFNDFKRQMTKTLHTGPSACASNPIEIAAKHSEAPLVRYGARLAGKFSKNRKDLGFDFIKQLSSIQAGGVDPALRIFQIQYHFLEYAQANWVAHTARIITKSSPNALNNHSFFIMTSAMNRIWRDFMITKHPLATPYWDIEDRTSNAAVVHGLILDYNHMPLLNLLKDPDDGEPGSIVAVLRNDVDLFALALEAFRRGKSEIWASLTKSWKARATERLYEVAQSGDVRDLPALLAMGAIVNPQHMSRSPVPVYIAAENGHLAVLNKLIEAGGDINRSVEYNSNGSKIPDERAIHAAIREGHLDVFYTLLLWGAQFDEYSREGKRVLVLAARRGHEEIPWIMTHLGVQLNGGAFSQFIDANREPLEVAMQKGHSEVARVLIKLLNEHKRSLASNSFSS